MNHLCKYFDWYKCFQLLHPLDFPKSGYLSKVVKFTIEWLEVGAFWSCVTKVKNNNKYIVYQISWQCKNNLKSLLKLVLLLNLSPALGILLWLLKSSGDLRLCIDYRSLNEQFQRCIEEMLSLLGGQCTIFFLICFIGYWQLLLSE